MKILLCAINAKYKMCIRDREKHVSPNTPPTFLWHTMNDTSVPVENSILFLQALHRNHVMCECHLFAEGIHGSSTCCHEVRTRCV